MKGPSDPRSVEGLSDSRGEPEDAGVPGGFRGFFLRLYPRGLRDGHGPEMAALLQRRLERARGSGRPLAL